ncbi:MAG: hypothetical protein LAT77_11200 [Aliidiomarina sp.]|uniref:alginate O-acetyltransferase AlgX-related protein n=1 Tax=Aliidiomarina sp. TaxID=1872439 RepID=UPI0025BF0570|nr:hypothetical protein [Aliidiomarina sp.]MCH8502462.1 hypothetical protein [Aliidiomarina sp.]
MSSYTLHKNNINFRQDPVCAEIIHRWCVDFPEDEKTISAVELEQGISLHGWVLLADLDAMSRVEIVVQQGEQRQRLPLNIRRPDVVKTFTLDEGFLRCGFRHTVPIAHESFVVGVALDGRIFDLTRYHVKGPFAILRGEDGWLFLDNDTNKSVAQHTGDLLMAEEQQAQWQHYFVDFATLAQAQECEFSLLVAPAKEAVYAQYHPLPRSPITIVEQLQSLAPEQFPLVYPTAELAQSAEYPTFRRKDTHWTQYGAMLATLALLRQLNVAVAPATETFAKDEYREREVGGDLGNKLYPVEKHRELFLVGRRYQEWLRFDNGLQNFGRCLTLVNMDAIVHQHILIFGSSSAYTMLDYIGRVFARVTLIHSAGNIDPQILKALAPDVCVAQTNGRFTVVAPRCDYDLANDVAIKWGELSITEQAERRTLIDEYAAADSVAAYLAALVSQ